MRHNRAREATIIALAFVKRGELSKATAALSKITAAEFGDDVTELLEELNTAAEASATAIATAAADTDEFLDSLDAALQAEPAEGEGAPDETVVADTETTQLSDDDAEVVPNPEAGPDDTVVATEDEDEDADADADADKADAEEATAADESDDEDEGDELARTQAAAVARLTRTKANLAVVASLRKAK